ncbi:EAL domain-containing protein [Mycolicibacterium sediminis]|uniref:Chemotaxis protein CheR n=1 Tax=Mycolicibacterium sediminis TaxID=1286180 RepID=A0A7I7QM12_9MYCO|nr:EAL domain-containing protein [Mycolicibacterium sediminis]BBY27408.1 hypothetical protein MSEDJ_15040 [Mycolicibacterium sediminis]
MSGEFDGVTPRTIVVGSSAGGLDSLTALLRAVPARTGWCFVVAQHLGPTDRSMLVDLLQRITPLRVVEATDGARLEPEVVFVAPPGTDVVVSDTTVGLSKADGERRPWPSIDRLFASAATSFGEASVGIVLSGTGQDGAAGVAAIGMAGGVVIAQDHTSAAFESMPDAADATGAADLRLPPQEIPDALDRILADSPAGSRGGVQAAQEYGPSDLDGNGQVLDDAAVETTVAALRSATGVDYSGYKRTTLRRQIERRLRVTDRTPADYADVLAASPGEATALTHGLLVGVTAFFRDRAVWDEVAVQLRGIVDALDPATQLRMWVPGCASGEEVYTLAMLAAEALGGRDTRALSDGLKVFATDLNESALVAARRGRYSEGSTAAIPPALRERWLTRTGQDWEVTPDLRECVVIARHNVAFDPPFPRLHLISLRNTMIYFQPHLQERVLELCRFALLPDGLLILGKSENVPRLGQRFSVAAAEHRIYRRRSVEGPVTAPTGRFAPMTTTVAKSAAAQRHDHDAALYRRLLRVLASPSLVLDGDDRLLEVVGDVTPWCAVGEGRHFGYAAELVREPYRLAVRTLLSQLRHGSSEALERTVAGPDGPVTLRASRVGADGVSTVVSFGVPLASSTGHGVAAAESVADPQMTKALESAQDALQATIEDLSGSNEELQALNEELQASTEELQASTEEAQASNEELEAANEELVTLNQELQARSAELTMANADLENIQASLTSGLVIVDRDLRVLRYTPIAVRLFSLIPEDVGRPIPAVPTTIAVPTLAADLHHTIASRTPALFELSDATRDLLLQLQPYLGSRGEVLGALVIVIDVGDVAEARRERQRALTTLETVAGSVREFVWQRDGSGAFTFLNDRVADVYGLDGNRVAENPTLLTAAIHPADRTRVAAAMASADRRWQLEYRIVRPDGGVRWIDESAAAGADDPTTVTGSALDVTDRHRLEVAASERGAVLDALLTTRTVGMLVLDADDRILQASDLVAVISGHRPETLVGTPLNVLLEPEPTTTAQPSEIRPGLDARRILGPDGAYRAVTLELLPVALVGDDDARDVPGRVALVHDVTQMRETTADLAAREQFDQQTGLLTRTYFRSRTDEQVRTGGTEFALLWIDLDGFKEINDRFGHRSGDILLATIATRLRRAARRYDVIGRLGGDEFAMLVTRVRDLDGIETLVHRILAAVREPIDIDGTLAYVSASVGIAMHPRDGATADELLHNADTAMYAAKHQGRDRHVYFASDMNLRADERAEIRRELAGAVRNREFELHYQPVLDVTTREVAHVEALVRWRRNGEIVTADAFLGHAAETGQLRGIGRIVLALLDSDIAELHRRFGDARPRVAVNLSGAELEERDIIDWLVAWNPAGGFERVIVEVTESVLLAPGGRSIDTVTVLRRLGATISIDDFGTGYSNLEALDRLQPDIIKIDRSLLERAGDAGDGRGANILRAAVQLARALDAAVVMEGVSDEAMWERVRDLGVDLAQGYFLAPPMPMHALLEWIGGTAG